MESYDLVILGGGTAAFAAATEADRLGIRTVIINDGLPMGNRGTQMPRRSSGLSRRRQLGMGHVAHPLGWHRTPVQGICENGSGVAVAGTRRSVAPHRLSQFLCVLFRRP